MSSRHGNGSRDWGELAFPLIAMTVTGIYLLDVHDIGRPETNLLLILPVSVVVGVLAIFLIVWTIWPQRRTRVRAPTSGDAGAATTEAEEEQEETGPTFDRQAVLWVVLFATYLVSLPFVSFLVATPVYLAVMMYLLGVRSWKLGLATMVGVTAGSYVVFEILLDVGVP